MSQKRRITRRALMLTTGIAGAGAALSHVPDDAPEPGQDDTDPRKVVLKDTDHIRTYYRLARS